MTNLVTLAQQLKGAPDQALAREATMPSGAIPPFLVQAEMSRRTTMRREAAAQQPQRTVLEDSASMLAGSQAGPVIPAGPGVGGGSHLQPPPGMNQTPGAGPPVNPLQTMMLAARQQGVQPRPMAGGGMVQSGTSAPGGILGALPFWQWQHFSQDPGVSGQRTPPPLRMFGGGMPAELMERRRTQALPPPPAMLGTGLPALLQAPPAGVPLPPPVERAQFQPWARQAWQDIVGQRVMPDELRGGEQALREEARKAVGDQDLTAIKEEIERYRGQLEHLKPSTQRTLLRLGLGMAASGSPFALQAAAQGGLEAFRGWDADRLMQLQGIGAIAGLESTMENLRDQYRGRTLQALDPIRSGVNWQTNVRVQQLGELMGRERDEAMRIGIHNAAEANRRAENIYNHAMQQSVIVQGRDPRTAAYPYLVEMYGGDHSRALDKLHEIEERHRRRAVIDAATVEARRADRDERTHARAGLQRAYSELADSIMRRKPDAYSTPEQVAQGQMSEYLGIIAQKTPQLYERATRMRTPHEMTLFYHTEVIPLAIAMGLGEFRGQYIPQEPRRAPVEAPRPVPLGDPGLKREEEKRTPWSPIGR